MLPTSFGQAIFNASRYLALLLALVGAGLGCKEDPAARFLAQGDDLLKAGQFSKAAEQYRLATEAKPLDGMLWERRAFALMRAGQLEEAVGALLRVQEFRQDPAGRAEVLRNVASIYLQGNALPKAEQYFLEVVKLEPNDTSSLMWLAEMESQRGGARSSKLEPRAENLEKALGYYDRVLAAEPDSLLATVNKRIAVMKLIRYQQQQQQMAEQVAAAVHGSAKRKEAQARAAEHQQILSELESRSTLLRDRIKELQKQGKTLQR